MSNRETYVPGPATGAEVKKDGDAWTLGFAPRDPTLASSTGTVVVHGSQKTLERIDLARSDQQRIEILIKESQSDVIFPMDVLQRFFR